MPAIVIDENTPIRVEFETEVGFEESGGFGITESQQEELGRRAVEKGMGMICSMAHSVHALHDALPKDFAQVELEFGIKLDAEAGALLAKAGAEAHIKVALTWKRRDKDE